MLLDLLQILLERDGCGGGEWLHMVTIVTHLSSVLVFHFAADVWIQSEVRPKIFKIL